MKRNLVLVALFLFGLTFATSAWAQVAFQMSTQPRNVRVEGENEAVGASTLAATSAGLISVNSTLTITFAAGSIATNITNVPTVGYTLAGVSASAACNGAAIGANISNCVAPTTGNTLTITFAAFGPTAVGDNIVVSGVRVNANAAGLGATISATASSTVPAGAHPITFFITNSGPVASVMASTTVTVTKATGGILTCVASNSGTFTVGIAENFNQAFTTAAEETAFGAAPAGGATVPTELVVSFTGLPKGVTIQLIDAGAGASATSGTLSASVTPAVNGTAGAAGAITLGVLGAVQPLGLTTAAASTVTFTVAVTAAAVTGSNQFFTLDFVASTAANITPGPVSESAVVTLTSTATAANSDAPLFVANTQGSGLAFGISDCVTNLLFPWVTFNSGMGYDTGIAIANTTTDPFVAGGAVAQAGACTLYGYPTTTPSAPAVGTAVTYTTPSVPSGATWAQAISTISAFTGGFSGYIIAICGFQNGHGFAQISDFLGTNGAVSQGYKALVIPSPALSSRNAANAGKGEGLLE